MASIRKRGNKWQVQFRRQGCPPLTRSFLNRKDAEAWSRQTEVQADRHDLPGDIRKLEQYTLGELVQRYLDSVSPKKRGYQNKIIVLSAFMRHPICLKALSQLNAMDFASYRDERLLSILSSSSLSTIIVLINALLPEFAFPQGN
jgi:hypothetical protein